MMKPIQINKWDWLRMTEYKGQWQVQLCRQDKDGNFQPCFAKRKFGQGDEKSWPISIPVGEDPGKTFDVLLEGMDKYGRGETIEKDDPPF